MKRKPVAILELMLGAKSKVAVLRALFQSKPGYSGSTLAKFTGVGRLAVQNTLASLESMGIVQVERGKVEHRYRLNAQHYFVANALRPLFDGERRMTNALTSDLRKALGGKVLAAGLFGSFARGAPHAGSDIDVFVVVRNAREYERVGNILAGVESELTEKYGWPVQAVVFILHRLLNRHTNGQKLLDEAERDWQHITGLTPAQLRKSAK